MNKTWKLIVAGFMGIIVGGLQVPYTIVTLMGSVLEEGFSAPSCILFTMKALFAFFAIAGGTNHLQRTRWPLAMAGSIAVFFCFAQFLFPRLISWSWSEIYWFEVVLLLPGIATIVLTALSKKEFK
jgi:tetrahydromethanopterin S-methyltransferase subunit C